MFFFFLNIDVVECILLYRNKNQWTVLVRSSSRSGTYALTHKELLSIIRIPCQKYIKWLRGSSMRVHIITIPILAAKLAELVGLA